MKLKTVSPSILDVNKRRLPRVLESIKQGGAGFVHIDVMDGKFVPKKSFRTQRSFDSVLRNTDLKKDIHIMVDNPIKYANKYLNMPIDSLTFHYEACKSNDEVNELIDLIHSKNIKAGISIKPGTNISVLKPFLHKVDFILIMSVEPGLGGQEFQMDACKRIAYLNRQRARKKYSYLISVDGGINGETSRLVRDAGANVLVSGSYVFKRNRDAKIKSRVKELCK